MTAYYLKIFAAVVLGGSAGMAGFLILGFFTRPMFKRARQRREGAK
jgi:hypothetical protein